MALLTLKEDDYFDEKIEMHFAHLVKAENIAPTLHKHEFYEIFLITKGKLEHFINAKRFILETGSVTFIRPNDAHYCRKIDGIECHIINLAVTRKLFNDLLKYLGEGFNAAALLDLDLPPTLQLSHASKLSLESKLEQLNNIPLIKLEEKRTALRILLFELVIQYFAITKREQKQLMPSWLEMTCERMKQVEHLNKGVARMLELSGVSHEHLARTCKRYLKLTPTAFINQLRLNYAANNLIHGDQTIIAIAFDVGFESISYFYYCFKKEFKMTPKQFREHYRLQLNYSV